MENKSIWQRLADGELGTVQVNTDVGFDQRSVINLGATIFVSGVLVILAYFAFKKQFS